jgi:hypothetical protein
VTRNTNNANWLELGVGSDGTAIAVWDYDNEDDVWAAVFR